MIRSPNAAPLYRARSASTNSLCVVMLICLVTLCHELAGRDPPPASRDAAGVHPHDMGMDVVLQGPGILVEAASNATMQASVTRLVAPGRSGLDGADDELALRVVIAATVVDSGICQRRSDLSCHHFMIA
ncbi:MAG: hypothetical protein ABI327_15885 [Burkholderiaceae bacterium]